MTVSSFRFRPFHLYILLILLLSSCDYRFFQSSAFAGLADPEMVSSQVAIATGDRGIMEAVLRRVEGQHSKNSGTARGGYGLEAVDLLIVLSDMPGAFIAFLQTWYQTGNMTAEDLMSFLDTGTAGRIPPYVVEALALGVQPTSSQLVGGLVGIIACLWDAYLSDPLFGTWTDFQEFIQSLGDAQTFACSPLTYGEIKTLVNEWLDMINQDPDASPERGGLGENLKDIIEGTVPP